MWLNERNHPFIRRRCCRRHPSIGGAPTLILIAFANLIRIAFAHVILSLFHILRLILVFNLCLFLILRLIFSLMLMIILSLILMPMLSSSSAHELRRFVAGRLPCRIDRTLFLQMQQC